MLTAKQHKLLTFIERYIQDHHGTAPSYDEMAEAMGTSVRPVRTMLSALQYRKYIARLPGSHRAVAIIPRRAVVCSHCGNPVEVAA